MHLCISHIHVHTHMFTSTCTYFSSWMKGTYLSSSLDVGWIHQQLSHSGKAKNPVGPPQCTRLMSPQSQSSAEGLEGFWSSVCVGSMMTLVKECSSNRINGLPRDSEGKQARRKCRLPRALWAAARLFCPQLGWLFLFQML